VLEETSPGCYEKEKVLQTVEDVSEKDGEKTWGNRFPGGGGRQGKISPAF